MDMHKVIGKFPHSKRGFVLPYHKYTGSYNPLHEKLDNAVDALSMRHDICYRDNNTKERKHECNDIMLQELDTMQPRGFREKLDRKLTRTIIGKKRKLGWGIEWSDDFSGIT